VVSSSGGNDSGVFFWSLINIMCCVQNNKYERNITNREICSTCLIFMGVSRTEYIAMIWDNINCR
jgi:hypothetical protein